VDRQREQERAERVTLLHSRGGRENMFVVDKVAVVGVAPLRPSGKLGKMLCNLSKEGAPIQRIKGILEIDFQQDFGFVGIARAPLPDHMDSDLGPKGRATPHLERP